MPDPATGKLAVGSEAMAYRDPKDIDRGFSPERQAEDAREVILSVAKGEGIGGTSVEPIDVGTRLRVVNDPSGSRYRDVQVRVAEGKHAGDVGTLPRAQLRPLAAGR